MVLRLSQFMLDGLLFIDHTYKFVTLRGLVRGSACLCTFTFFCLGEEAAYKSLLQSIKNNRCKMTIQKYKFYANLPQSILHFEG